MDEAGLAREAAIFEAIYQQQQWGGGSGTGSRYENNIEYISLVANFIARNAVRSVVDFGCGDWQFSRHMNWEGVGYHGFDVVGSVIERNQAHFGGPGKTFTQLRDAGQLPPADLLLCKDVFQHLPNAEIAFYLARFKQLYRWLLITNDDYPNDRVNGAIHAGGWRAVRLDAAPFNQTGAAVLSWTVISETPLVRKRSFLMSGDQGRVDAAPARAIADIAIPKRIFQTWKVHAPLPENFAFWAQTVRTKNPDYEYMLWDDADNLAFIGREFPWFLERYLAYDREIKRADAVRYFWLYQYGGFYLDLDVECLQSLDQYLQAGDVVLGRLGPDPSVWHAIPNAIMAAKPGQEFWLYVIDRLCEGDLTGEPEFVTGPILLKQCVDDWQAAGAPARQQGIAKVLARLTPAQRDAACRTAHISLRPAREWYPLDWTDQMHQAFRNIILTQRLLSAAEKAQYFPGAAMVSYWAHSW